MDIQKVFYTSALVFAFGACSITFADNVTDKIEADDFVEEVSAQSIAEVENAKVALEKSTSTDIKAYARKMITDHSSSNVELAGIASRKNIEVSDDAELTAKAKKFVLEQRDGQSFDEAYANNQVKAHENTIELFQRAAVSSDPEIALFAKQSLPKLQRHLKEARELAAAHDNK